MRTCKAELPVEQMDRYQGWLADFGDWKVAWEAMPADFPPPELFRGLPDDHCQAHHLGYLLKGSFKVTYADGTEETVRAGDAYSLPPGHLIHTLEPVEVVEFTPKAEWEATVTQIEANLAAASS